MNSLYRKSISQFVLSQSPSSRLIFISLFNTKTSSSSSSSSYSANYSSSSSASSPSSFPPSRRHDEESKTVRVSVWWDIENCQVPNGVNVFKIAHSITSAVRANGIKGPLQITAFGDVFCLSKPNQEALSSTGVNLVHIPQGGKNSADRSLLVDLMYWVSQNPPPAHIFLISSDRDFAGILHKLRMNNYNILLAGKESARGVLCSAASIMWHWNDLVKGENLSGRLLNQPPDGPFNSWYGHYKGPLEDPFNVPEPQSSAVASNSTDAELSVRHHSVPLSVLRQIRRILSAYPNGISITDLRLELKNNKVPIDKDFFGHKKFSRFLQSMPHIIKVDDTCVDGQFFLRPASQRVQEAVKKTDSFVESMSEKQNQDIEVTKAATDQTNTITKMVDVPQLSVLPHIDFTGRTVEEKAIKETPDNKLKFNIEGVDNSGARKEEPNSKSDVGLFKRLWTNLFGADTDDEKTNKAAVELDMPAANSETETNPTNQYHVQHRVHSSSSNAVTDDVQQPVNPSSGAALNEDAKSSISDDSKASPGFITRVINWCKSLRNSSVKTPTKQSSEEPILVDRSSGKLDDASHSRKHELFSNDTFWSALHSFFKTRRGSDIVFNSTSREQFAENLQKEGPLVLRPFKVSDLHHLVDLLVSEKKWIVEFPTKIPRFSIAHPPKENSVECQPPNAQLHHSSGSSSIFTSLSFDENHQSRISNALPKKPSEKSRNEVLVDCQRLTSELISKYPEGFNMGCFKKYFLEKYGYHLDHQKLGYPKLVSLLQIMPGVKVESAYVYSDKVVYSSGIESLGLTEKLPGSDSDVSYSPQKKEDGESPWEELGPVEKEKDSTIDQVNGKYEPSVSDDEFSELEDDDVTSSSIKEDRKRSRAYEEDSSLLQILDSWYSTKDESDPQDPGLHSDGLVDCSKQEQESSQPSNTGSASAATNAWKQTPQKSDPQDPGSYYEVSVECSNQESELSQPSDTDTEGAATSVDNHAWEQRPQKSDPQDPGINSEGSVDCSDQESESSQPSKTGTERAAASANNRAWKQRPQKSYLFVSDPVENKDKLIDGILGSLKKSGDSRMQE